MEAGYFNPLAKPYADDLVISSPRYVDIRKGILQIENNLTSIGLTLHKTRTDSIMKELSDVQNNEA